MDNQTVIVIESSSLERHYRNNDGQNTNTVRNSDDVPLQLYYNKTRADFTTTTTTIDSSPRSREEDNVGRTLQRSQTARRPPPTPKTEMINSKLSQSKSMRLATGRTGISRNKEGEASEEEELRLAMQRAWAVLETNNENSATETTEQLSKGVNNLVGAGRIQTTTPLKTLTTRIYIDDAKTHKVVQLTNLLTTAMVVQYLRKKGLLDNSEDWTLFEIDNSRGIERPLREWEIVLDILTLWNIDASNALLVKKYSYHHTLTSECVLQKKIPPMHGWLSIEYKKGKWQKRYCFVKDSAIYHAKDNKPTSSSSVLCHLATYDVYTLLQPLKTSPTPYLFAIRAQEKSSIFEKESNYIRFLAVDDQTAMRDWVLSIRCAKSYIQYHQHPNRVKSPLAPIISEDVLEETPTYGIRRHKSARDLNSSYHRSLEEAQTKIPLPRSESTRRLGGNSEKRLPALNDSATKSLPRTPTLINTTITADAGSADNHHLLADPSDGQAFIKGSLLAREEEPDQILYRQQQQELLRQQQQSYEDSSNNNNNTLIHIEERIKFAKGSLLDKKENAAVKMSRSTSAREVSPSNNTIGGEHRRHVSLRRKPTGGKRLQHHDVPLPNNAAIASLPSSPPPSSLSHTIAHLSSPTTATANNNTTLLRLDDTPERFHTRELRERHVKPLLDFDSDKRPSIRK
ncbi:MAG: hypothetical protein EXX96DRAFT_560893 [Benjaminiella poitrasii]|nr:MAG: hypothetical protein EXX96DRAFT_560893 [Benjaminiella poitrasii]